MSCHLLRGLELLCPYCGENVGRDDKLRVHLFRQKCDSQFPCAFENCPEKFRTKSDAKKHKYSHA